VILLQTEGFKGWTDVDKYWTQLPLSWWLRVFCCELLCSRRVYFKRSSRTSLRRFRFVSLNWSGAEIMNTLKDGHDVNKYW